MKKIYILVILLSMGITQIYAQCYQCTGTNNTSFKIGNTTATGENSFAGGNASGTTADNSFVFGSNSMVTGLRGIALGNLSNVSHPDGIAIGNYVNSAAANAYLFGQNLSSGVANSITIGLGTSSSSPLSNSKPGSIMFGVTHKPSLTIAKPANTDVGYLGIGTDAPEEMVHINEGNLLLRNTSFGSANVPNGALIFDLTSHSSISKWGIEYLNLGNLINRVSGLNFRKYGDEVSFPGAPNSVLFLSNNERIGIGTTEPQSKLDVAGSLKATSATITDILEVSKLALKGNLGLGTDKPEQKLQVNNGNILLSRTVPKVPNVPNASIIFDVNHIVGHTLTKWGIEYVNSNNEGYGLNFWRSDSTWGPPMKGIYYSTVLFLSENGFVGIGKNKPTASLDVDGAIKATSAELSGALKAASATLTGALKAASANIDELKAVFIKTTGSVEVGSWIVAKNASITKAGVGELHIGADSPQPRDVLVINNGYQDVFTVTGFSTLRTKDIFTEKVEVKANAWSDHVFYPEYELRSLPDLEQYIKQNHHLPEIPSASDVLENGIDLGNMQSKLLLKIEELTLYILQQNQQMMELQNQINELKNSKP